MSPEEILNHIKAEPFRPFRIRMVSGQTYDVRHPEMVKVTRRALVIFSHVSDRAEVYETWESASLVLIEAISHLDAQVS